MKLSIKELHPFKNDIAGMFRLAADCGCAAVHIHLPDKERLARIKAAMRETGVGVASVGAMSWKMLGPDVAAMAHEHRQIERALAIAHQLEAPTVSQFLGHDPTRSLDDNIATFADVYEPHAMVAERLGLRLAFENCPMFGGLPAVPRNLFYAPFVWDLCFAALDSPALGIEFDVSHFPYVGIDPVPLVERYRDRIAHVHLKDTRLLREQQQHQGILQTIPHEFRVVGEGEVPVQEILVELNRIGYDGFCTSDYEGADLEAARRNVEGIRQAARTAEVAFAQ